MLQQGEFGHLLKPVLRALNLEDPSIISAGTQICNPKTGKILWQKTLPEKSLKQAIRVFQQNPKYKLLFNDSTEDDYFFGGVSPDNFAANDPVYFLEQVFVPDDIALEMHQKLNAIDGVTCVMVVAQKPGRRDLHVINSSATKEHAVVELIRLLEIDIKNTTGIGDGHNDIHLFNAVHYKIAMGNSVPELKERADLVVESVEKDGMARYLQSLIKE